MWEGEEGRGRREEGGEGVGRKWTEEGGGRREEEGRRVMSKEGEGRGEEQEGSKE